MKPPQFDYKKVLTVAAAVGNHPSEIKFMGGGQSLGPMLNMRLARPESLIDLHDIEELKKVTDNQKSVLYGAATTHAEFEDGIVIDPTNGMLRSVAKDIAYRAIRNRGTLGGSLAHADPAADWVNVMVALDAEIHISGPKKARVVKAHSFFHAAFMTDLEPDEIIVGVSVPRLSDEARWGYYKFCRKQGEFSDATGSVVVDPPRGYARVVLGALDGPPIVLEELADVLAEKGIDAACAQSGDTINKRLAGYDAARLKLYTVAINRSLLQLRGSS